MRYATLLPEGFGSSNGARGLPIWASFKSNSHALSVSPTLRFLFCWWMVLSLMLGLSSAQMMDLDQIDQYVQTQMKELQIPGLAYAIVKDGRVVHIRAFGIAGPDGRAMTTKTMLNAASVGKTLTALAAQRLVGAGRLDLDAPVQQYLPWFTLTDKDTAARIKVQHLLAHTSGLSNAVGNYPMFFQPGLTSEQLARRSARVGASRPVGQSYEYSNLNYLILGEVVAAASSQSYERYVQEKIFEPLGMKHSFFSAEDAKAAGLDVANGYRLLFGFPVAANVPVPRGIAAMGDVFTTIEDLARYAAVFANQGVWQGKSLVAPDGRLTSLDVNYNNFWEAERNSDPFYGWGFSGAWVTYTAGMERLPNLHFGVVMLANANTFQAWGTKSTFDLTFEVMRLYHGWSVNPARTSARTFYAVADAVLLLLVAPVAVRAWGLPRWFKAVAHSSDRLYGHLLWIVVDVVLPLAVLLFLPFWATGIAVPWIAWERVVFSVPDLSYSVLMICLALLVIGLARVILLLRRQTGQPMSFDVSAKHSQG